MIRERVSTNGVLRTLEPESALAACTLPIEKLGLVTETGAKRYLEGQALYDKKYKGVAQKVIRDREHHLKLSRSHTRKVIDRIQRKLNTVRAKEGAVVGGTKDAGDGPQVLPDRGDDIRVMLNSPLWTWSWVLQGEDPPPSSIAARGDTVGLVFANPSWGLRSWLCLTGGGT